MTSAFFGRRNSATLSAAASIDIFVADADEGASRLIGKVGIVILILVSSGDFPGEVIEAPSRRPALSADVAVSTGCALNDHLSNSAWHRRTAPQCV